MENAPAIAIIVLSLIAAGLIIWSFARKKVEAATIEGLADAAEIALEEADKLLAARARGIESDKAALASDAARIAAARSRLAAPPQ